MSAKPETVARGLATSGPLAAFLAQSQWLLPIDRARKLGGASADRVQALEHSIAEALRHDELVLPLQPTIEDASKAADQIIFEAAQSGGDRVGVGLAEKDASPEPPRPRTIDTIDVPLTNASAPAARRRSQVRGDALPDWLAKQLPVEAVVDLLVEVSTSGGQRLVVSPTVARLVQLDPKAQLSGDGRRLTLPRWNLELSLED